MKKTSEWLAAFQMICSLWNLIVLWYYEVFCPEIMVLQRTYFHTIYSMKLNKIRSQEYSLIKNRFIAS